MFLRWFAASRNLVWRFVARSECLTKRRPNAWLRQGSPHTTTIWILRLNFMDRLLLLARTQIAFKLWPPCVKRGSQCAAAESLALANPRKTAWVCFINFPRWTHTLKACRLTL